MYFLVGKYPRYSYVIKTIRFIFKICDCRLLLALIKNSVAEVFEQVIPTGVILSLTAAILFRMVLRDGSSNVQGELVYSRESPQ